MMGEKGLSERRCPAGKRERRGLWNPELGDGEDPLKKGLGDREADEG
jgi:hypothetical protein